MKKCEVCKRKVPLVVSTYAGITVTLMCLSCLKRAMTELNEDSNFGEWKKIIREEKKR